MNMRWFMVASWFATSWFATLSILLHVSCSTTDDSSTKPAVTAKPSSSPNPGSGPSFIETSIEDTGAEASDAAEEDASQAQLTDELGPAKEFEAIAATPVPSPNGGNDADFPSVPSFLESICVGFEWVRPGHCNWCKPEQSKEVVTQHQCSIPSQCGEGDFGAAGWGYSYKKCP